MILLIAGEWSVLYDGRTSCIALDMEALSV